MSQKDITKHPKPVVLVILDGWGIAPDSQGNAITRARTPNHDELTQHYFSTTLHAAGEAVGLRWGEVGNSEVGHLNIGSGKIIFQPQLRIDRSIIDGSFFDNQVLLASMKRVRDDNQTLHLVGLLSDTGVHSTIEHLYALLELAEQEGVTEVAVHVILDGRDTPYNSGVKYVSSLMDRIKRIGVGRVVSISGRFWAMDRDNRWDRIERAYNAIIEGIAQEKFTEPLASIKKSYKSGIYDEEFNPAVHSAFKGIFPDDDIIFFNFRADRSRQLTNAIIGSHFRKFKRKKIKNIHLTTFTEYDETLDAAVVFPARRIEHTLASVVAGANLSQLHIAETEKYAHVTYFINGGREKQFSGEERVLIPSPPVTSYEEKPEMSAIGIRDRVLHELKKDSYDLYVVNLANADMVGHTGNLSATITAVETLDQCLGDFRDAVLEQRGVMAVTSDHGNAEGMIEPTTGQINKKHSALPVPFLIVGKAYELDEPLPQPPDLSVLTPAGLLSDVAPTILKVMNLKIPKEMTGRSLI